MIDEEELQRCLRAVPLVEELALLDWTPVTSAILHALTFTYPVPDARNTVCRYLKTVDIRASLNFLTLWAEFIHSRSRRPKDRQETSSCLGSPSDTCMEETLQELRLERIDHDTHLDLLADVRVQQCVENGLVLRGPSVNHFGGWTRPYDDLDDRGDWTDDEGPADPEFDEVYDVQGLGFD